MRATGRLQQLLWGARVQLRKSAALREIVRRFRSLAPDTRERHLRGEVEFWRRWMLSEGLSWPGDFKMRFDPAAPLQDYLVRVIDELPQEHVELLDVGAGPLTVLGKVHPTKSFSITATDVLAREYNALLDELGLVPPVRTDFAATERLVERFGTRRFDIVHARNTLDHSEDPIEGIEQMLELTRVGGCVVLVHEENEGSKELYHALHKWDFTCDDGHFIVAGPGPGGTRRDVTAMVSGRAEIQCSFDGENIQVILRKVPQG